MPNSEPADSNLDLIDINHATPEALAECLVYATKQIRYYTAQKERFAEALTYNLEIGKVEPRISHCDCDISFSAGRVTYSYPESIGLLEANLQEAKAVAVASGLATEKHGKPFWSVREQKGQ